MVKVCKSGLIRIAGAMVAAGLVASAQAALVPFWDYELTTQFSGDNAFTDGTGTQIQTGRQVSWGSSTGSVFTPGTGRSGITINDSAGAGTEDTTVNANTGTATTNALTIPGIGLGAWITHHNNPISGAFATLRTSEIDSTLSLWANPPGDTGGDPDEGPSTLSFKIFFAETPNAAPCVVDSPVVCNDIFALNQADALNKSFEFGGEDYFVSIFPIVGTGLGSFSLLSDAACEVAGADAGCIGFTTVEGQNTTIRFGFAITAEPVVIPEPGSLALVGLSLGLVGLLRRRRA